MTAMLILDSMRMSLTKIAFFFIRYFPPLLSLYVIRSLVSQPPLIRQSRARSTQFYGAPRPHTYSPRACYVWNVYQGLGLILTVLAVDYILILRSAYFRSRAHTSFQGLTSSSVFAMFPRNTPVKTTTAILYAAEITTMAIGFGIGIPKLEFDDRCVTHESPTILMVAVYVLAPLLSALV